MSWKDLENAAPDLAAFGLKRLEVGVAYLATLRQDGAVPVKFEMGQVVGRFY